MAQVFTGIQTSNEESLARHACLWGDNINTDNEESVSFVDRIQVARNKEKVVSTVMNLKDQQIM
jgi:hypothetical protein